MLLAAWTGQNCLRDRTVEQFVELMTKQVICMAARMCEICLSLLPRIQHSLDQISKQVVRASQRKDLWKSFGCFLLAQSIIIIQSSCILRHAERRRFTDDSWAWPVSCDI